MDNRHRFNPQTVRIFYLRTPSQLLKTGKVVKGTPRGAIMVARDGLAIRIAGSLCRPGDAWDRQLAIQVADGRMRAGREKTCLALPITELRDLRLTDVLDHLGFVYQISYDDLERFETVKQWMFTKEEASFIHQIESLKTQFLQEIKLAFSEADRYTLQVKYLGKNGLVTNLRPQMAEMDSDVRRTSERAYQDIVQTIEDRVSRFMVGSESETAPETIIVRDYERNPVAVVARVGDRIGAAFCNPEDNWDSELGRKIAIDRASKDKSSIRADLADIERLIQRYGAKTDIDTLEVGKINQAIRGLANMAESLPSITEIYQAAVENVQAGDFPASLAWMLFGVDVARGAQGAKREDKKHPLANVKRW